MSILVVGSVAYDDIITPFGSRNQALGGSAIYFALAAHHFTDTRLVAVVGENYKPSDERLLADRKVDTRGIEHRKGQCFYWKGEYLGNWNDRITHATHLNVFEQFDPVIPDAYRDTPYVFLGNINPELQMRVLDQIRQPKLVALDTMNMWISQTREALIKTLSRVDLLIINDSEARQLSGETSLIEAARTITAMGPKTLCIKRGEHGAFLIQGESIFVAPAYPLCDVVDPTGAGDAFAGGLIGYLAAKGESQDFNALKIGVIYGSVMGSFTVESFSVDKLASRSRGQIGDRYTAFVDMTHFDQ